MLFDEVAHGSARVGQGDDEPSFVDEPGTHVALFSDHGVVHVRDVAVALLGADTPEASEIEPSDVTVRWRGRTRTTTLRRLGPTAQSRLR